MYQFFNSNKYKILLLSVLNIVHSFLMVLISLLTGFILEYAHKGSIFGFQFKISYIVIFLFIYIFTVLILYLICFNMINKLILRQKYFLEQKLIDTFSSKFYNSSKILNLFSHDLNVICEDYYKSWFELLRNLFFIISALILSYYYSPYLFLLTLALIITSVIFQIIFTKKIDKSRKEYQSTKINFNKNVLSYVKSSFSIKFFNGKKYVMKKSKEDIYEKSKAEYKLNNYIHTSNYLITLVPTASSIFVAIVCTYLLSIDKLSYSNAVAMVFIVGFLMWEVAKLLDFKNKIDSAKPIKENLFNIINNKKDNKKEVVNDINLLGDRIILDNISVKYGNTYALKNVSLDFEIGKKYLILGESGSGKSTLIKLLLKDIDNYSGDLFFCGINIRKISKKNLYKDIGYLMQGGEFIPESLGRNIALSLNYDSKRVRESLKLARYADFDTVNLDEMIDLENANFSGGELQRFALARLFYHKKSIYLLDEFTSALHKKMARDIERQILLQPDKTIITVSHRTFKEDLKLYDKIIILNDGEVIFDGKYKESNDLIKLYTI